MNLRSASHSCTWTRYHGSCRPRCGLWAPVPDPPGAEAGGGAFLPNVWSLDLPANATFRIDLCVSVALQIRFMYYSIIQRYRSTSPASSASICPSLRTIFQCYHLSVAKTPVFIIWGSAAKTPLSRGYAASSCSHPTPAAPRPKPLVA